MSDKLKGILAIIIGAIIGGATPVLVRIGVLKIPPFTFTFVRFLIASVVIIPFFIKNKIKFDKRFLQLCFLSLLPVINIGLFAIGVRRTTASIGQLIYAATPITVGLLSHFIYHKSVSARKWLYIFIGFVGVVFIIFLPIIQKGALFSGDLIGNFLIFIGMFLWAVYILLTKNLLKNYSPFIISSVFIFASTLIFFFLSLFEVKSFIYWKNNITHEFIWALIYLSTFGTVGIYFFQQMAIKYTDSILGSLSQYLVQIFTYFWAFVLLGEKLTEGIIIGTILIFVSFALLTFTKRSKVLIA